MSQRRDLEGVGFFVVVMSAIALLAFMLLLFYLDAQNAYEACQYADDVDRCIEGVDD